MPRRKQDCPKRMKWEEGGGECPKDGAEYPALGEGEAGAGGGSEAGSSSGEKKRKGEGGGGDEEEEEGSGSGSSSEGEEAEVRLAEDSRPVTVSLDSTVDKDLISSDVSAREEEAVNAHAPAEVPEEKEEPEVDVKQQQKMAAEVTYHPPAASPTAHAPYHPPEVTYHRHPPPLPVAEEEMDDMEEGPLDFSVKKKQPASLPVKVFHASVPVEPPLPVGEDAPLDLSVSSRKRPRSEAAEGHVGIMQHVNAHLGHMVTHRNKSLRLDTSGSGSGSGVAKPSSPWSNQFPFRFSPSSSPNSGVEIPMWNGGAKAGTGSRSTPSPSTGNHYGEQQTTAQQQQQRRESSPVAHHHSHHPPHKATPSGGGTTSGGQTAGGRHNAWQSHWLSRGAEQAKDVLKCVWCRKSFRSLEEMTSHMKEARHCGMHVPHQPSLAPPLAPPPPPPPPHSLSSSSKGGGAKKANGDEHGGQPQQQMMKEQTSGSLPMPRKLVRGQDVWLGKGAEQTKQILKCMWCGQSFKTLAEMTTHMQQTQHYTNIISQEQIISWKSPEDKMAASGQAHVNAVLTCKVCDQAFSSLKELSNHMVKNSHYKEHILRSITENGGRRRQSREKRKKSLPVRKLLELERAQNEMNRAHQPEQPDHHHHHHHHQQHSSSGGQSHSPQPNREQQPRKASTGDGNGRITCEKCARKIDTQAFVDHIRLCVGNGSEHNRPPPTSSSSISSLSTLIASVSPKHDKRSGSPRKPEVPSSPSPRQHQKHPYSSPILQPSPTSSSESNGQLLTDMSGGNGSEAPSVLNAIERLIEKSFDGKQQQSRGRYVTASSGSNRTTPSTPQLPTPMDMMMTSMKGEELMEERPGRSDSEEEPEEDEEVMGYQKLVIDEEGVANSRQAEEEERRKSRRRKMRRSTGRSPLEEQQQANNPPPPSRNVRASPLSTGSKRDAVSPARSLESPGSCSNCSSHGTIVSAHTGLTGSLSLVRSSPSPSSPTSGADHPLKELQKLLDKTNVSLSKSASASVSVIRDAHSPPTPHSPPPSYAGWSSEPPPSAHHFTGSGSDVIHCNFCDNSFVSKSAFRHHVTKVHAKLMTSSAPLPAGGGGCGSSGRSPSASSSSSTASSTSGSSSVHNNNNSSSTNNNNNSTSSKQAGPVGGGASSSAALAPPTTTTNAPPPATPSDDSPHSKFLKYTELAKQLSSKYV